MTPIYYIKQGNLSFAEKQVLSDIDLLVYPGDKICLIGRNGCGKSSLMKIIDNEYQLDDGELFTAPTIDIGYLKQDIDINLNQTIYSFILEQFAESNDDNKFRADIILSKLKLDSEANLSNCSGGQIRRSYLARVLVKQPELLLLDEPTNHLDIETIQWLEEYVINYNGAIVCISHDRAFLANVTNKIWWLDRGILRKSDKGFKYFNEWQEIILSQEEAALNKLNKKLAVENQWLNGGVTARRKRNQKRLADLINLRSLLKQNTSKLLNAKQRINTELSEDIKKSRFIIEAENISFDYEAKTIIKNFNFKVKKGEKIGIIGPNGCGKSTLIKIITKSLKLEHGKIKHGIDLDISYFDQHRSYLDPNLTLQQILCPNGGDRVFLPNNRNQHVAAYLKNFMFDPKILSAKVSILSGGEASRLLLAKTLIKPGNLLILDEPTNDLDMDSLEILLEMLFNYTGTLIIVSHDRDFLNRLVTRTLVFQEDESIVDIVGGYDDYLKMYKSTKTSSINNSKNNLKKLKIIPNHNKLSYKHQRLLEVIPQQISILERRIVEFELDLSDHLLYLKNPARFNKITAELASARTSIDQLMSQWIEIEDM